MKLGAHVSISGGFDKALERAAAISANCLQIFSSSPRSWETAKNLTEPQRNEFLETKKKLTVDPIYFHATYLINLADSGRIADLSKKMLISELNLAAKLGIVGSIIHLGSWKKLASQGEILQNNIAEILEKTSQDTLFIIENAGNHKIGARMEEISEIVKELKDKRVRVCLDTCHLHAAGYDLSTKEKLDGFLSQLDKLAILDKLELIHANDSRDPFGSFRDRHENIGQGLIGESVFKLLLNHPQTKNLAFIIETPGFDGNGPDRQNLEILKNLVNKA